LVVTRRFNRYSIYTQELAESGDLLRPGTDRRILADVSVRETLDHDVTTVFEDMTLFDFAKVLKTSHRNHFPVLRSGSEELAGMLELGPIHEILLDPELARVTLVGTMMDSETPTIPLAEPLRADRSLGAAGGGWAALCGVAQQVEPLRPLSARAVGAGAGLRRVSQARRRSRKSGKGGNADGKADVE
jgi:hypothetical protein